MKIADENIEKFVQDVPYYKDKNDFCLGNDLNQAGDIVRSIIKDRGTKDVDLDKRSS